MRNKVSNSFIISAIAVLTLALPVMCAGWQLVEPGVLFYEGSTQGSSSPIKLWYYLPVNRKGKIPCIFIAPAGSDLCHGMGLAAADRPEHTPYVKAGFAVVAYEIEGACPEGASNAQTFASARIFMKANGGVNDGKAAINAALTTLKDIDANRLYTAGHSSAGTTALALAASDPRIKACSAFAPCCDLPAFFGQDMAVLKMAVPGFDSFVRGFSPQSNTASLKCPTFIFNASDDDNVKPSEINAYVQALKRTNKSVTSITVPSGGHHDSMQKIGIYEAIKYFRSL